MLRIILIIIAVLCLLFASLLIAGNRSWKKVTTAIYEQLNSPGDPIAVTTVDFDQLDQLPSPVRRYLETVLTNHQPVIISSKVTHSGSFNMSQQEPKWRPFRSKQYVTTATPGFDWNADIYMAPGVPVKVHDAYFQGTGLLHAAVFGLVNVAKITDSDETGRSELMRFLAESAWYPTALLPGLGVTWDAIDENSARATLKDQWHEVSLTFWFNDQGLIDKVSAPDRGMLVGDKYVPAQWQGKFWDYRRSNDMLVPYQGRVSWIIENKPLTYWQGKITELSYELTR